MSSRRVKKLLLDQLERSQAVYAARERNDLNQSLAHLERWQKQRLLLSYADFDANSRYSSATYFFRETLYAPVNLAQRDQDLERMVPTMVRVLPDSVLMTVAHALELQALSLELDLDLVKVCIDKGFEPAKLEAPSYCDAYRSCDNRALREQQIELLGQTGRELEHWVHVPFVYSTLLLCRVPARLAGLTELQHFLEEGFSAFRSMKGADEFLAAIQNRETIILEQIYAGAEDPFTGSSESG